MSQDDQEIFWIFGVFMGVVVLIFGVIFGFIQIGSRYDCGGYEQATGKPTKYVGTTCYIQDGGKWYAWEEYKNRFMANGAVR